MTFNSPPSMTPTPFPPQLKRYTTLHNELIKNESGMEQKNVETEMAARCCSRKKRGNDENIYS
jgi:hypothetical protein